MKHILTKALSKARQKEMSIEDTADLILDYLEIAKEIAPLEKEPVPEPPPVVTAKPFKAVDINRPVSPKRSSVWKTDELYSLLSKSDMAFSIRPDGWTKDLDFRYSLVKDPNSMKGVGVIWQAVEDPSFKQNYFFSVEADHPDVEFAIEEVKKSVNFILRRRDESIPNSTIPLRSIPSDIASMAGFSASV